MACPVHPTERPVGECEICAQEVCARCLALLSTPMDFECFNCGNQGTIVLYEALRESQGD